VTNDEDADRAVNSLNGQNFGGTNLVVKKHVLRQERGGVAAAARGRVWRRTRGWWAGRGGHGGVAARWKIAATAANAGKQAVEP